MKKYSLTTKASSRRTSQNKALLRIAISGLAVLLLVGFAPKVMSGAASAVLWPIHRVESWLVNAESGLPYFLHSHGRQAAEILDLRSKLETKTDSDIKVEQLSKENQELRALLGDEGDVRTAAGVVGRPNITPYDVLIIDRGRNDGIKVNAPVFLDKDTVIGVVERVSDNSSVVRLVTAPGFESTVFIYGPDIYTTAVGQGGGVLRVGVPQGVDLAEGNLVVMPSVEDGIFGLIDVVESVPANPEQFGYVTLPVSLSKIRLVAVGGRPLVPATFDEARERVVRKKNELFVVPVPEGLLVDLNSTSSASSTESTDDQSATSSEQAEE